MNIHFLEVAPGQGSLDYTTYLKRLAGMPHTPALMLEHLRTAEDYAGAQEHLFDVGRKAGLSFG
jgi:sugar phosphate isomerase/epimerase